MLAIIEAISNNCISSISLSQRKRSPCLSCILFLRTQNSKKIFSCAQGGKGRGSLCRNPPGLSVLPFESQHPVPHLFLSAFYSGERPFFLLPSKEDVSPGLIIIPPPHPSYEVGIGHRFPYLSRPVHRQARPYSMKEACLRTYTYVGRL